MQGASGDDEELDPHVVALMRELANGRTLRDAAVACNMSRSTAWRRLEDLRVAWGLDHTIQLIVSAVRRGLI